MEAVSLSINDNQSGNESESGGNGSGGDDGNGGDGSASDGDGSGGGDSSCNRSSVGDGNHTSDNVDDSLPGGYDDDDDGGGSSVGDNGYGDENHIDTGTHDVIEAVINAMKLTEEVNGSQQNFMSILTYGKELYYKGKGNELGTENEKLWPKS